jgi:hypothetical protein
VVGCRNCSQRWIVEWVRDQAKAQCPGCGSVYQTDLLHEFASADEFEVAAELRSRQLAAKADHAEKYANYDDYGEAGDRVEELATFRTSVLDSDVKAFRERMDSLYADAAADAESHFETYTDAYADQAEAAIERFDERRSALADRADEYLDGLFRELEEHVDLDEREAPDFEYHTPARTLRVAPTTPQQRTLDTVTVAAPPQGSTWIPDVIDGLLPTLVGVVEAFAKDCDSDDTTMVARRLVDAALGDECDTMRARTYVSTLCEYALKYHDLDDAEFSTSDARDHAEEQRETFRSALTNVGTGGGVLFGHTSLLWTAVVPVLAEAGRTPDVVVNLDAEAWDACDDRGTRQRSLRALNALADACETTGVCGPQIERYLMDRHPEWSESVTERRNPTRQEPQSDADSMAAPDDLAIYTELQQMSKREGKLKILSHLERNPDATVEDIAEGPAHSLQPGSLRPYIQALVDDHDLVTVDTSGRYNTYALSARGEVAVTLISDDESVVHPDQDTLLGGFTVASEQPEQSSSSGVTEITQPATSTVCGAARSGRGVDGPSPAEAALAATGDPDADGFVQWLPKVGGSAYPVHARSTAADRADGITFNPYEAEEFEDARTTYLSFLQGEAVAVTQFSGPLKTLVRIATALLSRKAWGKILTPSRVGAELDGCFEAVEDAVITLLRDASQVGWFSEDEEQYDDLRARLTGVACALRENLGGVDDLDADDRATLFSDAHGLLQSATALYHALDVPVTVDLRVPDKDRTNDHALASFLAETAPRQTFYGAHSVHRNTWEERTDKRKKRLGREVDPSDPTADLALSWVVTGPGADEYLEPTRSQLRGKQADRQDEMDDYDPIEVPIDLADASEYAGMRHAVEQFLRKKDLMPYGDDDRLRQTVRLFQAYTGSPYDVADALSQLRSHPRDVTLGDVESALSTLPASRLFPEMNASTPGKLLAVLLSADDPLSRADLLDAADISASSYDRYKDVLEGLDLIERVDGGKWDATIAPWYVPETERRDPRTGFTSGTTTSADALYEACCALGVPVDESGIHDLFRGGGSVDRDALWAAVDDAIVPWLDVASVLSISLIDAVGRFSPVSVTLGDTPDQATIDEAINQKTPASAD